jgi:hypothetical protein
MIVKYLVVIMARCVRDRVKGEVQSAITEGATPAIAMLNEIAPSFACKFGRDEYKEISHSDDAEYRAHTRPDLSLNLEFTPPSARRRIS